jgi:hypothetical protein
MRIALPEASELTRAPVAARPAALGETKSEIERAAAHVVLSNAVRASAAALTRALTDLLGPGARAHLSHADQLVLTVAAELVVSHGFSPEALGELALALARFRAGETTPPTERTSATPERAQAGAAQLVLSRFADDDEQAARLILGSLAMRDTRIDRAFVHALVAPGERAAPAVDLALVHRLVVTLSPRHQDGARDPAASFALRDARIAIADVLTSLALPRQEVEQLPADGASLGALLLRTRSGASVRAPDAGVARAWRVLVQLTRNDRALLSLLYGAQAARRGELGKVDALLHATVALRLAEQTHATGKRAAEPIPAALVPAASEPSPTARARVSPETAPEAADAAVGQTTAPDAPATQPRSYGSTTQLAAQVVERYRRTSVASRAVEALRETPAVSEQEGAAAAALAHAERPLQATVEVRPAWVERPLDLARALGLQGAVAAFHARRLRARRLRGRGKGAVRAIEELLGVDGEPLESSADPRGDSRLRRVRASRRHRRRR